MVTKKRFKVHSMIQDMEVGEIMDLELCEELIRKYGSLSDIHVLIEDNGNDMTYQEVVNLLNENEQLKQRNNRQYEQLSRLYNLIEQKEWRVLTDIIDNLKKSDEQLQKEWRTYGDV